MSTSATSFLAEIIDYAGLFPPAELSMADAVRRFLDHRRGPHGWLLARFVCPATRLAELAAALDAAASAGPPVRVSALGRGADSPIGLVASVERDVDAIRALPAGSLLVDQFELRLPDHRTPIAGSELVARIGAVVDRLDRPPALFLETSLLAGWREGLADAASAAAAADRPVGIKIRCGGVTAEAVPGAAAVAAAIEACRKADVPLKATQGLHHPFRHFDHTLEVMAHGFVNLFAAALLDRTCRLTRERLLEIIEDEDAGAFELDERGLSWRGLEIDTAAVADGRRTVITSFGSCSFTEPRDELIRLGLVAEDR